MALVNVMLNQNAAALLSDKTQVRIRSKNQQFQFRPTFRTNAINLPKGERLRPIFHSGKSAFFTVKEDSFQVDQLALIVKSPYGWFTLTPTDIIQKGSHFAKFTIPYTSKRQPKPSKSLSLHEEVASLL